MLQAMTTEVNPASHTFAQKKSIKNCFIFVCSVSRAPGILPSLDQFSARRSRRHSSSIPCAALGAEVAAFPRVCSPSHHTLHAPPGQGHNI